MWRRLRYVHVLLHVRAYGGCAVSLAITHMRWVHGQGGHESTGYTISVVPCVGGLQAWLLDTRMWANVNVRPRPLAQRAGKEKERKKEREM